MRVLAFFRRPVVLVALVLLAIALFELTTATVREAHQRAVGQTIVAKYGLRTSYVGVLPSGLDVTRVRVPLWGKRNHLRHCAVHVGGDRTQVTVTCHHRPLPVLGESAGTGAGASAG